MQRYEHDFVTTWKELKDLEKNGWELVAVHPGQDQNYYFIKRPIEDHKIPSGDGKVQPCSCGTKCICLSVQP